MSDSSLCLVVEVGLHSSKAFYLLLEWKFCQDKRYSDALYLGPRFINDCANPRPTKQE